jgi:hypothetical protein
VCIQYQRTRELLFALFAIALRTFATARPTISE